MKDVFNLRSDAVYQLLWQEAVEEDFGRFHIKVDRDTNLFAIIAIYSTKFGPALGGCRMFPYASLDEAFRDVRHLARGMAYKSALADLPLGGGKTVIIEPSEPFDRETLFTSFAHFINELGGNYITAVDIGTDVPDMDVIAKYTSHLATASHLKGDPSPFTAWGTVYGMEAAVKFHLNQDHLKGLHVVIQGIGKVGHILAGILVEKGANVTICDLDEDRAKEVAQKTGATVVPADEVFQVEADILAPCARGDVINDETVNLINTPIVAGAVNNLLAKPELGDELYKRGILCAPDYVINGGGLMFASDRYFGHSESETWEKVKKIPQTLMDIFERSKEDNVSPTTMADRLAEAKLSST